MGTDSGSWLSPELGVDVHAQLELEGRSSPVSTKEALLTGID